MMDEENPFKGNDKGKKHQPTTTSTHPQVALDDPLAHATIPMEDHDQTHLDNFLEEKDPRFAHANQSKGPSFIDKIKTWFSTHFKSETLKKVFGNLGLAISIILAVASSILIFVLTCSQFGDKTETISGSYVIATGGKSFCSISYQPWRARLGTDPEYMYCSWPLRLQMMRFFVSLLTCASPALLIYGIRKNKRWVQWLFVIASGFITCFYFWIMVADSDAVRQSNDWCGDGMTGVTITPATAIPDCQYLPYIFTCLASAGALLLWLVCSIVSFKFLKSGPSL